MPKLGQVGLGLLQILHVYIATISFISYTYAYGNNVINDDVLFQLQWPGNEVVLPASNNILIMTTAEDEQYQCLLPDESASGFSDSIHYTGLSATSILQNLLDKNSCTVRIESYWNYELCHGQHIRQFHESKSQGALTKLQEFFLGRDYKYPTDVKFELQNATFISGTRESLKIPTFYLKEREIPYFEVIMSNGTPCDLKDATPRLTRVHYICEEGSRNEMILQEETSTCEYRVVITTNILCSHPLYKTKDVPINTINCHPVNGSPSKPDALREMENTNARKVKVTESSTSQGPPIAERTFQVPRTTASPPTKTVQPTRPSHIEDEDLARQFLRGEHCLSGGKGWWKYEFCYKKYAKQYHVEKDGAKTNVLLGTWNEEKHREWWASSKKKVPVGAKTISHFYSNGDICDLTGRPRQVQVKLKCKENVPKSAVSLYLIEPTICNYILGVESSLLCPMFSSADEFGLF